MRSGLLWCAVAGVMLGGCTGSAPPPKRWSLAALATSTEADRRDNPAVLVDLMMAVQVARARCSGAPAQWLNRREGMMLWNPDRLWDARGTELGINYRRAYGKRWWDVLQNDMRATRAKYEARTDLDAFCQTTANQVQLAMNRSGADLSYHLLVMYRRLNPSPPSGQADAGLR